LTAHNNSIAEIQRRRAQPDEDVTRANVWNGFIAHGKAIQTPGHGQSDRFQADISHSRTNLCAVYCEREQTKLVLAITEFGSSYPECAKISNQKWLIDAKRLD
jgi:hypothetical protein